MPRNFFDIHKEDDEGEANEEILSLVQPPLQTTLPVTTKRKRISKGVLISEMEETFRLQELTRDILEEIQAYADYQVLPIAQNLTKENIECLLNAMRRK